MDKNGSVTLNKQNFQFRSIQICNAAKENSAPTNFYEIFLKTEQSIYNLRNTTEYNIPLVKTVYNGLESLFYFSPKLWNILSVEYEEIESLLEFKTKIKC